MESASTTAFSSARASRPVGLGVAGRADGGDPDPVAAGVDQAEAGQAVLFARGRGRVIRGMPATRTLPYVGAHPVRERPVQRTDVLDQDQA